MRPEIEYLMNNYYAKYKGDKNIVPTVEQLDSALKNHPEKVVVVGYPIKGIGIFLLLTDETYERLIHLDITDMNTLIALAIENGKNLHFVLLVSDSYQTIREGMRNVIDRHQPKTVSWWSPDFKRLHRYNLN